ncbi:peptidoglycan-binding domain-containing protein [Pseudoxanthomonas sacheonensis]|uniref:Peptidoglycan-binding protein n=1 Tax=Pseudoxanthomonas sacheonensis TaxID=443615 RepID=A0ABU1RWU1_9GAMM|nr:peptidoglycan-binding domain-containing protein [Pseudoxanthomonas sacheonensis]MDR6843254.1 hypothetical protein [Pseudoxanthomonas sacheonensis]
MADSSWHLGQTSTKYETGNRGAGTISTGRGDLGGVSYGSYQLSTKMGTLQEYLDQSPYKDQFGGLSPATPDFDAKWRELAKTDPGFGKDQHAFIKSTHFDVQDDELKARGIDLSDRGPSVQDALWSTSVQFRSLTPGIFSKGLEEKFGKDYELSKLSDKDIVEAVQDYKITHNNQLFSKSPSLWPGLLERAKNEKADLVALANDIVIAKSEQHPNQSRDQSVRSTSTSNEILKHGEKGESIRQLQDTLNNFGYRDKDGRALREDGGFGDRTKEAVQAYQQAHGLKADGVVGPQTLEALKKSKEAPLLSDPKHPDNALYQQAVKGLEQLGPNTFKNRQELENAAGATVFDAKASGLTRIDHVLQSTNGTGLFAVQGAPNDPAHNRVHLDKAQAAAEPIEKSTAQVQQEIQPLPQVQQEREQRRAVAM